MFLYEEAVGTNSARSEPMENHAVERTAVDSNSTCCWCLILTFGLVAHYTDPNPNVDRNDTSSHAEGDNGVFGRPTDFSHIIPVQVKSRKSKERFTETVGFLSRIILYGAIILIDILGKHNDISTLCQEETA